MEALYAASAMFAYVFAKAWQQRNVAFDHYWPVLPTSLVMAALEVYVIATIVRTGYDLTLVLSLGSGAGFGAMLAMYTHNYIFGGQKT